MIVASLSLVIAQRLSRTSCRACLESDPKATPEALKKIGFSEADLEGLNAKHGRGCPVCNDTGYKGRRGIYEVLRVTAEVEEKILAGGDSGDIIAAARSDGFRTMQEIGRELIAEGVLDIAEYQRVLVMS